MLEYRTTGLQCFPLPVGKAGSYIFSIVQSTKKKAAYFRVCADASFFFSCTDVSVSLCPQLSRRHPGQSAEMPPKGSNKQQSEEDLLLQDFSRNLSAKSTALFYGNALIVSAIPICKYHTCQPLLTSLANTDLFQEENRKAVFRSTCNQTQSVSKTNQSI